jgi:hypothetical protein
MHTEGQILTDHKFKDGNWYVVSTGHYKQETSGYVLIRCLLDAQLRSAIAAVSYTLIKWTNKFIVIQCVHWISCCLGLPIGHKEIYYRWTKQKIALQQLDENVFDSLSESRMYEHARFSIKTYPISMKLCTKQQDALSTHITMVSAIWAAVGDLHFYFHRNRNEMNLTCTPTHIFIDTKFKSKIGMCSSVQRGNTWLEWKRMPVA